MNHTRRVVAFRVPEGGGGITDAEEKPRKEARQRPMRRVARIIVSIQICCTSCLADWFAIGFRMVCVFIAVENRAKHEMTTRL